MKETRNHTIIIHPNINNAEVGRPAPAPRDPTGFFSSSRGQHLKQPATAIVALQASCCCKVEPNDCCSFCCGCRCHMKVNGADEQGYWRPQATNSVPVPGRGYGTEDGRSVLLKKTILSWLISLSQVGEIGMQTPSELGSSRAFD
jgi:hypothetical protein